MRERLAELAARHGLELVGVTDAGPLPEAREHMEESVAAGRMARMDWMGGDRPRLATDPRALDPAARSVIVVAAPYAGADRAGWDPRPDALRQALAPVLGASPADAGRAHRPLRARHRLPRRPAGSARGAGRRPPTARDCRPATSPTSTTGRSRSARWRPAPGMGWIGKNANLLTHARAGSWVFLGALLTSAELPADEPIRTTCGSCTRCLSGCPTGAIVAPQTIDARRCISYLTIEHPGVLSPWEADAIGDWIFGCDVCQEVCPVNADADDAGPLLVPLLPLIEWLLPMGGRAFARAVGTSALTRAGRHRLLRNAIAALGNAGELSRGGVALLERARNDRRAEVREQAERALSALS